MSEDGMDQKINDYLDESLEPEEVVELSTWIKAHPANARRFARAAMLHDRLQGEMAALKPGAKAKTIISFPVSWLAIAAMVAVLGIGIWTFSPWTNSAVTFATIVRVEQAEYQPGERRGRGILQLESGMLRLLFDSGVEVTLQGPGEFELRDGEHMLLNSGLLTAHVPPGAEGFRVDTPTAQIIDLGTAFGVHFGEDGSSHVSVFDGEVEIEEPESGTRKRLTEGQEAVVSPDHQVESVSLDPTPYEKLWPVSTGIKTSEGPFELAPPWPRRLPLLTSNDQVFVALDGYRKVLGSPLKVNVSKPGEVALPKDFSPTTIPAGTPLRSYILHYRPEEVAPRRFPIRFSGSITFDQPIAGVILAGEEFTASAGIFSHRKVGEMHPRRQLELSGYRQGDRIEVSDDMRTLTVDLAGSRKAFDVIRVVVDASRPALEKSEKSQSQNRVPK